MDYQLLAAHPLTVSSCRPRTVGVYWRELLLAPVLSALHLVMAPLDRLQIAVNFTDALCWLIIGESCGQCKVRYSIDLCCCRASVHLTSTPTSTYSLAPCSSHLAVLFYPSFNQTSNLGMHAHNLAVGTVSQRLLGIVSNTLDFCIS